MATIVKCFDIQGMCCGEEVQALRQSLANMDGVLELEFNLLQSTMTVTFDDDRTGIEELLVGIRRANLQGRAESDCAGCCGNDATTQDRPTWWHQHGRAVLCATSGALLLTAILLHTLLHGSVLNVLTGTAHDNSDVPLAVITFYALAALAGGWYIFPKAWNALRNLRADMNLLMTVAVIGAAGIGEWLEAATVTFLFALSLLLESWSVNRARGAIRDLLDLAPHQARLVATDGGEPVEVAAEHVEVNQHIAVRPGERFPLDGEVVRGSSSVNQAPITGESALVEKSIGDQVFAGTINEAGAVEIRVTQPSGNTTLARIGKLVEQAQLRKAPAEQWVDRFARWYTPAMIAIALLIAVIPPLLFGGAWNAWLYQALVMLVIACPCALVISTPVSIVSALTSAARQGVLIKGGVYLEAAARIDLLAIDKTGTLTVGKPKVQHVIPLNGHSEVELLTIAATIESHSEHPVGKAIVEWAATQRLQLPAADNFQAIKGRGATATIDGRPFWAGSQAYLQERAADTYLRLQGRLQRLDDAGHTLVAIGSGSDVCGLISLSDAVRAEAAATIRDLHRAGITRIMMLTGDNAGTARAIAEQLGIDEVHANLLPEQKLQLIQQATDEGRLVAMAGDGINDAPALAAATIGIAMGTGGSDAAIETANIALMSDDLTRLPWLVAHARRTLRVIKQNIAFALGLKAVFIILAILQLATLWMAIAADMGASLLVTFNALRLLR